MNKNAPRYTICLYCDKPATYIRHTQFSGNHPFCTTHAKTESDFNKNDSYKYWEKLKIKK